jgi:hypothetical protein
MHVSEVDEETIGETCVTISDQGKWNDFAGIVREESFDDFCDWVVRRN